MKIIFCVPGKNFSNNFLVSWTKLIKYCNENNIEYELSNGHTSIVHLARYSSLGINPETKCNPCKNPFGGQYEYDYIMFIDSDMVFEPWHLQKLLDADKKIVTGVYRIEKTNYLACHDMENNKLTIEDVKDEIIPVSFSGMGFMLIKKGVFESMQFPYFTTDNPSIISETISFCMNLQKTDIQLYADTSVVIGHEKQMII
tara:strand:- start:50 stop:649 length:600 start_codon:yes stop_codon:yes gene_type:complete